MLETATLRPTRALRSRGAPSRAVGGVSVQPLKALGDASGIFFKRQVLQARAWLPWAAGGKAAQSAPPPQGHPSSRLPTSSTMHTSAVPSEIEEEPSGKAAGSWSIQGAQNRRGGSGACLLASNQVLSPCMPMPLLCAKTCMYTRADTTCRAASGTHRPRSRTPRPPSSHSAGSRLRPRPRRRSSAPPVTAPAMQTGRRPCAPRPGTPLPLAAPPRPARCRMHGCRPRGPLRHPRE